MAPAADHVPLVRLHDLSMPAACRSSSNAGAETPAPDVECVPTTCSKKKLVAHPRSLVPAPVVTL
jgi:hypothetical protein